MTNEEYEPNRSGQTIKPNKGYLNYVDAMTPEERDNQPKSTITYASSIDQSNTLGITMEDIREEFLNKYFLGNTELTDQVIDWWLEKLNQQTTLAYNAGKADILDTVLKEINEQTQKCSGFNHAIQALDMLKHKLLDNK